MSCERRSDGTVEDAAAAGLANSNAPVTPLDDAASTAVLLLLLPPTLLIGVVIADEFAD